MHNITVVHRRRGKAKVYAEIAHPSGFIVSVVAIGTFVYFLEALIYLILISTGAGSILYCFPFHFQLQLTPYTQVLGLILTLKGYFLFIWSIIARGRYAVSWQMPESQKLVT